MTRTPVGVRVYHLAERFNITLADTERILNGYKDYIKTSVASGREVDVGGLVVLYPMGVVINKRYTLAYDLKCLANQLRLPCYTVTAVVQQYIEDLRQDILCGDSVEIRGIVSITPVLSGDTIVSFRAKASKSLKGYCIDYDVNARVRTHMALKQYIGRGLSYDRKDA